LGQGSEYAMRIQNGLACRVAKKQAIKRKQKEQQAIRAYQAFHYSMYNDCVIKQNERVKMATLAGTSTNIHYDSCPNYRHSLKALITLKTQFRLS
jgi:hypothetical protein